MGGAIVERGSTTCLLADDHPAVVAALARYLSAAGFAVVATARGGEAALAAIASYRPRVCVCDVRMPRVGGLEVAREAAEISPETDVLLYSGHADLELVAEALDAGAAGIVLKDAPLEDLARALEMVAAGVRYLDPVLLGMLAAGASGSAEREPFSACE